MEGTFICQNCGHALPSGERGMCDKCIKAGA